MFAPVFTGLSMVHVHFGDNIGMTLTYTAPKNVALLSIQPVENVSLLRQSYENVFHKQNVLFYGQTN